MTDALDNDEFDAAADETISECLNLSKPRSFFLYAGAGSGKTRSLVNAIRSICTKYGHQLSLSGRKIGVITYTNAACDEIKQRLEFDPRVEVSTIHAFAWSLIGGHNNDIRKWVDQNLLAEIAELEAAQAKGRATSKAAIDRARSIESKLKRRAGLKDIRSFTYSPTGDNRTRDSLSHAEVIKMTSSFLITKRGLRSLLIARFPILLIDESQDTNQHLIDALLDVQTNHNHEFCLGLFGDTMQRIYTDGKTNLAGAIPDSWARPIKRMNHRCPTRIVELINKIRADEDRQKQRPRSDAELGVVRLFVMPETLRDKSIAEANVARRMAQITGDPEWDADKVNFKTLALEHLMAARRFGFEQFFKPLYEVERLRTGMLDGTGAGIGLFTREILPLTKALALNNRFATAAILRSSSPLLDRNALQAAGENQVELLRAAKRACEGLQALFQGDERPTLLTVLRYVARTEMFTIPDVLAPLAVEIRIESDQNEETPEEDEVVSEISAWRLSLEAPFDEIERYDRYVSGMSQFDTHQGVKGLEFPRVMVVISDEEARGFLFSYEKLFGAKEKSKVDRDNEAAGNDTTIGRTRRLFYVICSRAESSLAIVYYSSSPAVVRDAMIERGWFSAEEIIIIDGP